MKKNLLKKVAMILTVSATLTGLSQVVLAEDTTTSNTSQTQFGFSKGMNAKKGPGMQGKRNKMGKRMNGGKQGENCNFTVIEESIAEDQKVLSLTGYGAKGAVSDDSLTVADMLTYAAQDEYLAKAEYDAIMAKFGEERPFINISKAEIRHADMIKQVMDMYKLTMPKDESKVTAPETEKDALNAGITAEKENIAMYEKFLKTENIPQNAKNLFERLLQSSKNHLNAFERTLENID